MSLTPYTLHHSIHPVSRTWRTEEDGGIAAKTTVGIEVVVRIPITGTAIADVRFEGSIEILGMEDTVWLEVTKISRGNRGGS